MIMMLKSSPDNLFTSVLPRHSQYPSFLIKFLMLLESEKLIPLFKIVGEGKISAFVTTKNHQILSVQKILQDYLIKDDFILFYGSHFQVIFEESFDDDQEIMETFLIFTTQGLILENDHVNNLPYQFIEWDCWDNISIIFDSQQPKCSLLLKDDRGNSLIIKTIDNYTSETQQIEAQLPLLFCYGIMKRYWQYVEQLKRETLIFNPQDFLYLNHNRLSYLVKNILPEMTINEENLCSFVSAIIS